ncbi:hypothetical protein Q9Q99_14025 [Curtobacterium flaccumfaciens]|nr:hypothetical protein Q9Q99_14025 [Curtobacterium flaccumfaciens]
MTTTPQLERHWARFEAWCTASVRDALPATPETVEEFLTLFPGSKMQQRIRRRAIAVQHLAAGELSPIIPVPPARVWKGAAAVADIEQALAEIPKYRHHVGLRGRRDAFLIVLVGFLQLTRQEARHLSPPAIELGSIVKVRGRVIPSNDDPVTCLACAVTRWLRVVGNAYLGHRAETRALLDSTKADLSEHGCGRPISEQWRRATELVVPLDTHGWARTGVPLSTRSISSIIPARRRGYGFVEDVGPHTRKPTQFDDLSAAATYRAAGELEATARAAFARSAKVLAEVQRLGVAIDVLLAPMAHDDQDQESW